jgi:hypothetical protein
MNWFFINANYLTHTFEKYDLAIIVFALYTHCLYLAVCYFVHRSSSSFPLGSFSLCFWKHLSLMAYCTIPVLDFPTFSAISALPRPLSRENWSCIPVIYMFPTFGTSRLREILAAQIWNCVGEKWPVNFSLKMPYFNVAFRDILHDSKSTTWDPQLYFPYEGKRAEDFFFLPWKIRRLRLRLNPRTLGSKGQHATF